jgi:hypothetical protein
MGADVCGKVAKSRVADKGKSVCSDFDRDSSGWSNYSTYTVGNFLYFAHFEFFLGLSDI